MKFCVVLFLCLFLTGCAEKEVGLIYVDQLIGEVEVYDEVYLYDIFDKKDVELITDNIILNTNAVGELTYQIKYKYNNKKYRTNLVVNVVDTEAPRYLGGTNKTVLVGYDGALCDLIMYGDNYDGSVICTVNGIYNLDRVGTYDITYVLTDSSNNVTEVPATLNVVKQTSSSSVNTVSKKYEFSDILENYKTGNNEIGIDVSKWQGEIDFAAVKEAGASFVMIRIGLEGSQSGDLVIDSYFEQNYENAVSSGLKVGVYFYSIATSKKEAIEQANWVVNVLDGRDLDLPIVFDWENWSKWNSYKLSFYDINSIADNFMNRVTNAGYRGMLYSSKYYLENIWTNNSNYPVWLANYTSNTSYEGDYLIWQICNTGRIAGIDGDVDIDILYY